MIDALVPPFYDPLRLAEDLAVARQHQPRPGQRGVAGGYVPSEFEMFGVPSSERADRLTETLETLRAAFTGEPFEFRGRTVQVTPRPTAPAVPGLMLGGSSEAAARRAARLAVGFIPISAPECWEFYRDECLKLGRADPGG